MKKALENLAKFSRLHLGFYPTPLQELPRLRKALGRNCPRIFIKRDDWTGFGFGGNKIRKQEFLFARLLQEGIETVITTGGERSNHARMTAFVCAKTGIKCILVLDRKPRPTGTLKFKTAANFLENLLGAELHLTDSIAERNALAVEIFENLKNLGAKVCQIPLGGASSVATLGFVSAMRELAEQTQTQAIEFDYLFFSSSTAGTQAGMLIGAKLFGLKNLQIIGISPEPQSCTAIVSEIESLLTEVGVLLEIETGDIFGKIKVLDHYAGEDYCVETAAANAAKRLLAETEAVLLDSVYTAKTMAGLIDRIQRNLFKRNDNVLFWHTGGTLTEFYLS